MWAVDTNLLVRYYTRDDAKQAARAKKWMARHLPCFVPISVVLELHWVLESAYGMKPKQTLSVMQHLANSPAFQVESGLAVQRAISAAEHGLAFDDALHWALSYACEGIATFDDRGFARKARKLGMRPPVAIPE